MFVSAKRLVAGDSVLFIWYAYVGFSRVSMFVALILLMFIHYVWPQVLFGKYFFSLCGCALESRLFLDKL